MNSSKSVVALVSGGLDSTVLVWELLSQGYLVRALSVDYAQRHRRELLAATEVCKRANVEHRIADLSNLRTLFNGSSQTSDIAVPEGHYTDESMKKTVVPNRNMVMLSVAGAWAVSTKSDAVAYAAHGGDHAIYPDCRPGFTEAMENAFQNCDWHKVKMLRPFVYPKLMSKADLVILGAVLNAPLELTYSCYNGREKHCGKCGTCVERQEAFTLTKVPDPTEYECAQV